eukprot:GFUD01027840.1.p1 GENE.GFUD01027840.1~~GFUD01027840.1.p1  ORF type:complete len:305 (-),score=90.41 GFUD01027840.1:51-965(-)
MSSTTRGIFPLHSSLLDPSFGIPTDVTYQIMGFDCPEEEVEDREKEEIILGEVKGHKLLLGLFSTVFKGELFGPAKETRDVIPVRETTPEAFEKMVDYIYSKDIEWGNIKVLEMYEIVNLAERYHLPGLMEEVKIQMEMIPLTMEDVVDVAHTAAQLIQFPDISSTLLLSCAKFVQKSFQTPAQLLQFATNQSGDGQESTVRELLALVRDLPDLPPLKCSNCGEEECQDGKLLVSLDKVTSGCKLAIYLERDFYVYPGERLEVASVVSLDQGNELVEVQMPDGEHLYFPFDITNMEIVVCYKCD